MYDELDSIFRDWATVQCGLTYFEGTERPLGPAGFQGDLDEMFDGDDEGNRGRTEDSRAAAPWSSRKRTI